MAVSIDSILDSCRCYVTALGDLPEPSMAEFVPTAVEKLGSIGFDRPQLNLKSIDWAVVAVISLD